jgi:S-adenosylmethionine:tRNA ribosyltransferase-isomerase
MVSSPLGIAHTRFRRIADYLEPEDLLVVNTSPTIAAAVPGTREGWLYQASDPQVVVHFSGPAGHGQWVVELRDAELQRLSDGCVGERIRLPHGATLTLKSAWPDRTLHSGSRLWLAELGAESGVASYLRREGRAIAYDHVTGTWPLSDYQTIFAKDSGADQPGSAEMASAGRPFSHRVVADLKSRGIRIAPLLLHTGVSSLEAGERPLPERYDVPATTAQLVNATRARGGRVIATGTTVTRALETVAAPDGTVTAGCGITDLVIDAQRPVRVVNGLITGWHEPEASHLLLLEAVAGADLVAHTYAAAVDPANGGYLWHEFGDSCLLLP